MEVPEVEKQIGIDLYYTSAEGLGGVLRQEIDDFIVKEITNRKEGKEGRHLILELTKRNWDMHHVMRDLSRKLGISQKRIGFAGTKDKRAVTTQKISIFDLSEEEIEKLHLKDVELRVIGMSKKGVQLGDLTGNEFIIAIRDIDLDVRQLQESLGIITDEILETGGVPNFFGIQRFGAIRPITHLVGEAIVKGDPEEAALRYIARSFPQEPEETKQSRDYVFETKDFAEGLKSYPTHLRHERAMMHHLVTAPDDFVGSFGVLSNNIRKMFVHAYQSYMFNMTICERIRQGLPLNEAVDGDIVCFKNKEGLPDATKTQRVTADNLDGMNNLIRRKRAFVTAPLIGYEVDFASEKPGEIEMKVFERMGINIEGFKVPSMPDLASKGRRREILLHVEPNFKAQEDELNPGKTKAILDFSLPKGSYATTVLREYMKTDPVKMS